LHHVAKSTYYQLTQYGGGRLKINPLLQTYEHWYRNIHHQFRNQKLTISQINTTKSIEETIQALREAQLNSSMKAYTMEFPLESQESSSSNEME